jgi:hypothetical protein
MSLGDILAAIKGYRKREQTALQAQALVAYRQAQYLGNIIGVMLDGKQKLLTMTEAFPGIFPEFEQLQAQGIRQQDWRLIKARIEEYSARQRARRPNVR